MTSSKIKPKSKKLNITDCGLADYTEILQKQHQLHDKRLSGEISNTILIVEHRPVITIGARKTANKLLLSKEELADKGINLVEIRRGGGSTAHNPGQLVVYPILNIKERRIGASEYVRELEQVGIELLEKVDIKAERKKGYPGLWVGERKIASIGVRVSKGITYHGIAININNDLSIFDYIVPCGLEGTEMTSVLKETDKKISMSKVKNTLSKILLEHFG